MPEDGSKLERGAACFLLEWRDNTKSLEKGLTALWVLFCCTCGQWAAGSLSESDQIPSSDPGASSPRKARLARALHPWHPERVKVYLLPSTTLQPDACQRFAQQGKLAVMTSTHPFLWLWGMSSLLSVVNLRGWGRAHVPKDQRSSHVKCWRKGQTCDQYVRPNMTHATKAWETSDLL